MLKLNVNVCRKISDNNYGSRGAGCSLEIELDSAYLADPAGLQERIRSAYAIVAAAVADELREGAATRPAAAPPAPQPARTNGHAQEPRRGSWGDTANHGEAARRGPPPDRGDAYEEPEAEAEAEPEEEENPPETGRQLLGWASNQDGGDAKGFLIAFGKKSRFPGKIVDWNAAQVKKAYQAARRSVQS